MSQCEKRKAYSEAVDLLLQEIRKHNIEGKRSKFYEKLKTIYRVMGQEQAYLALLDDMALAGDIDWSLYQELKSASPDTEWPVQREKLKVSWQTSTIQRL